MIITEIAISFAIIGRVAIETTDDAREDAELLARIVTHDSNFSSHTWIHVSVYILSGIQSTYEQAQDGGSTPSRACT